MFIKDGQNEEERDSASVIESVRKTNNYFTYD